MYKTSATHLFKQSKTVVEESNLKLEFENFAKIESKMKKKESTKVELFSVDAVWWASLTKLPNIGQYERYLFEVNIEAHSAGVSLKNLTFQVKAILRDTSRYSTESHEFMRSQLVVASNRKGKIEHIISTVENSPASKLIVIITSNGGSLVVDFTLSVVHGNDDSQMEKFHDPTAMKNEIVANHSKMLDDSTFSDFTFIVQGKQFKVHKNILGAASEVFVKLFTTKMAESEKNKCKVTHLDPNAFEHMLRFIYSGRLPQTFNAEIAQHLFETAHYYNIKTLKKVCEQEVLHKLAVENALEFYKWAELYELEDLKKEAWVIIKRDMLKIFFPLEPLSLDKIQEILQHKLNEKEYWRNLEKADSKS